MKVIFNKTLAKIIANSETVTGSCGSTHDRWQLSDGTWLSVSTRSNYAYVEPKNGTESLNKRLLKAAPVGAKLFNYYTSSWAGCEYKDTVTVYLKGVSGAWVVVSEYDYSEV